MTRFQNKATGVVVNAPGDKLAGHVLASAAVEAPESVEAEAPKRGRSRNARK